MIVPKPKGMVNIHAFGGTGTTVENFISSVVFSDLDSVHPLLRAPEVPNFPGLLSEATYLCSVSGPCAKRN